MRGANDKECLVNKEDFVQQSCSWKWNVESVMAVEQTGVYFADQDNCLQQQSALLRVKNQICRVYRVQVNKEKTVIQTNRHAGGPPGPNFDACGP